MGHLARFPAAPSGAVSFFPQSQVMVKGIARLPMLGGNSDAVGWVPVGIIPHCGRVDKLSNGGDERSFRERKERRPRRDRREAPVVRLPGSRTAPTPATRSNNGLETAARVPGTRLKRVKVSNWYAVDEIEGGSWRHCMPLACRAWYTD